jgi:hypothetical protein
MRKEKRLGKKDTMVKANWYRPVADFLQYEKRRTALNSSAFPVFVFYAFLRL